PAIQGVRPNGLHDVARTDERRRRSRRAIREGGQPVFLAPVDVDDVDGGEPRPESPEVPGVRGGPKPGAEGHSLDARATCRAGPRHDPLLAPRGADQRCLVSGPLHLPAHLRRPVDVGGPAPTRDEMDDLHERRARPARASRYRASMATAWRSGANSSAARLPPASPMARRSFGFASRRSRAAATFSGWASTRSPVSSWITASGSAPTGAAPTGRPAAMASSAARHDSSEPAPKSTNTSSDATTAGRSASR